MYKFFVTRVQISQTSVNKYFICAVFLLSNNVFAGKQALNLPQQSAVPGGIVNLEFSMDVPCDANTVTHLPKAYFNDKQVLVIPKNNCEYIAVIGLPLDTKPGEYNLNYYDLNKKLVKLKFDVANKDYKTSTITIKNNNMVEPDPKTLARITSDQIKITKATAWTSNLPDSIVLNAPVPGVRTTSFGSRRIINNISKNPHTGMDIAAKTNTKVFAAADGQVVLAENFYLPGNMVGINHGSGLITLYAHLNSIKVKVGQTVKAGELIGLVGSTGRVTGPHLHWAVKLNQAAIDPELFLKQDTYNG